MEHEGELYDIQALCRLCLERLHTEAACYDLLAVPGLATKLAGCAGLTVQENDGYPHCICGNCYTRLNDLHEFKVMCLESTKRFRAIIDSNKVFVAAGSQLYEIPNAHEISFTLSNTLPLEDDERLNFDPLLNPKIDLLSAENEGVLKMLEQKSDTGNNSSTDNEADSVEENSNESDSNSSDIKIKSKKKQQERQSIIECHICHKKFKKVTRYHDHMKYHNDKLPYQCTIKNCNRGFTTANGLRLHIEHSHSETIPLHACPEAGCDKKFPRTRQLNWHLKKVHKRAKDAHPKTYPCTGCDKIFRCPMSLKKHMYKHDGKELPFPCNICGKRFVINSALKDHLMRHAGIKNYVCPYCGVGKTTRQEWNTHIAIHTHEKQFKCDLCPHASHNKQNLRMHIKIVHEKIKDYACQYCGKTFAKSNGCKMHEMTHTGEKRCECKVCGKRFLYAKSLTKHLKTHEKRVLRAIEVYRKRQIETNMSDGKQEACKSTSPTPAELVPLPELPALEDHSKETHQKVADEILKVCAESAATIPKDPRRVERVDIIELAGTAVNPIPSVAVPSWSPQINFMMKEGPHICPDCGQGFNGLANLKRHHRIVHEGVKDFACRFCHKRFAKAQTLKHHEMTHTGEKPHECKECGKRFIQSIALKRHMKVHGNTSPTIPTSVYEERVYEAREEMQLAERAELAVKHKAQEERAFLAEVAKEQLSELEQIQLAARSETYEVDISMPVTLAKDLAKSNKNTTIIN